MIFSTKISSEEFDQKFEILNWLISPRLTKQWITSLPKDMVLTAVTILFMVEVCLYLNQQKIILASQL